ncbi:MAG TPA: phosphoribosyltransferase [Patescibacteria group bacterium]|nr:phosphoribosyltransferase [Patescibacteria group bacterium]
MKDLPSPSEDSRQAQLEMKLRSNCPRLFYERFEWVSDPDAHLVIDDLSFRFGGENVQAVSELVAACQGKPGSFSLYQLPSLCRSLAELSLPLLVSDPESTLIVYPGEGAESTRLAFPPGVLEQFQSVSVEARRIKDAEGEVIGVRTPGITENIATSVKQLAYVSKVIVVDDVIDSGKTLLAIKQQAGLDDIPWYAMAPIMFSPLPYEGRTKFPSSIPGFEELYAGIMIQGEKNPVDLNDLSSFLIGGEKTQRLLKKCINQFVTPQTIIPFVRSVAKLSEVIE